MENNYSKNIENLTKKLVNISSICGKPNGEKKIAKYIYDYFKSQEYFKKHPNQLMTYDCGDNRYSTLAYIKGKTEETIILMGHIDTVDVLDYGKAKKEAFNPEKITKALKDNFNLDEDILEDIKSEDYLFGRGALDMKSGVAAYMEIMKYFASKSDKLNGNLVFICECDEEGDSKGIIKSLEILKELKEKEGFKYLAAINGDYDTVEGNKRYIYLGTVGKLLPSFLVVGKESHVGNPFRAFDPNLLIALINKNMAYNQDLTDKENNITSMPPISLKQSDNKDLYTVQTPASAFSYFNYLIYNSSPKEILNKCLKIGKESFKEMIEIINNNYSKYCKENSIKYKKLPYKVNVYSYDSWQELLNKNPNYQKEIKAYSKKLLKDNPHMDMREYSYKVLLKSYDYYEEKQAVLIVFYSSMFYSNIKTDDKRILKAVNEAIKKVQKETEYKLETKPFYPYISDMSFLSTPFKKAEIDYLLSNTPYPLNYPYKAIKDIDVPVINIGTYGKAGHSFSERVQKSYTFKQMPRLVEETINAFFEKKQ